MNSRSQTIHLLAASLLAVVYGLCYRLTTAEYSRQQFLNNPLRTDRPVIDPDTTVRNTHYKSL
jgi:hypothetical protein